MKTSIVYCTFKTIIRHEDADDPEDLLEELDYSLKLKPLENDVPVILETELVLTDNVGECHPTEYYLLKDK